MRASTRMSLLPASKEIMGQTGLKKHKSMVRLNLICLFSTELVRLNQIYIFFNRVGQIEESIFEVAVKMNVANLVGGGSTDIR